MFTRDKLTDNDKKLLSFAIGMIVGVMAVMLFIYMITNNQDEAAENITVATSNDSTAEDIAGSDDAEAYSCNEVFAVAEPIKVKDLSEDISEEESYNGEVLEDNGRIYAIKVNRQENIVTIYTLDDDGYYTIPVKAMSCSTAEGDDTPTGIYTTSSRYRWAYLQGDVCGQYAYRIVDHILFHSVPYLSTDPDTLETWEYNKLGTDASMGCIRLCAADAKWIYENCESGTLVEIFDSDFVGPLGRPSAPYTFDTDDTDTLTDYDPTDMTEGNPYAGRLAIYGAESHHIDVGEPYDEMAGIMAFNADMEDVTDQIEVSSNVDNEVPGSYEVTYYISDENSEITKTISIIVDDTSAPVIASALEKITIELLTEDIDSEAFYEELESLIADYITVTENGITCLVSEAEANDLHILFIADLYNCRPETGSYYADIYLEDAAGNVSETVRVDIIIR